MVTQLGSGEAGFELVSVHFTTSLQGLPRIFQSGHWDCFLLRNCTHMHVISFRGNKGCYKTFVIKGELKQG